jgi:trehalose 6-phosphate synthase/phosphatase
LPEGDFVEGGVELSPEKVDNPLDMLIAGFGSTRPLLQLEEMQLEEFWPSGPGLKAVFLDYDGTLREFENKPEWAVPTDEIIQLLTAINDRADFVPHIISGRDATFLETHFGHLSRFTLVAEHGFQIWRAGHHAWELSDGTINHETWKAGIRSEMSKIVHETPGSHLEEKASCLVWHYREVSDQTKAEDKAISVITSLQRLVEDGNISDVRISHGNKIVEASFKKVRKGPIMRKLCEEKSLFGEPYVGVLTAGDDVSDESMFDAAPSDYLTVKVGQAETSARYRAEHPEELRRFLWRLLERRAD